MQSQKYFANTITSPPGKVFLWLFFAVFLSGCALKNLSPEIVEGGVRFSIKAPDAKRVAIAGSFNRWDTAKDALSGPDGDGVWSITLPLKDGRYEYLFLIDGEKWLPDPSVPSVNDEFGGRNSVIYIRR
ncbi:MAG: glycogen-binding domain-containing protein [Nitrospirae bacterium]|nr:glycogen-binding domain-containing protein [Nitrospirota bacterium]